MASIINASTSGVGGVITTADNSGDLNIQSGGSTKIAVTSAGVAVTGLAKASLPTGSVLQVVNATYSSSTQTSTSTYIDTGLTATITPSSASSKILVIVHQNGCYKSTTTNGLLLQLLRNSTSLSVFSIYSCTTYPSTADNGIGTNGLSYLDSPATTSAVTYKTQMGSRGNNAVVYTQVLGEMSTITLMEIAA
jgi:hypothetical protein